MDCCTFSTAALTVGNHSLTAYYNGDANRAPSLSAVRTQTVNTVTTTTTLTSSANPVAYGTAITFTAVVSTASATGTVSFSDGTSGVTIGSCGLSSGRCSITVSTLMPGLHPISARYGGDALYSGSASSAVKDWLSTTPFSARAALRPRLAVKLRR